MNSPTPEEIKAARLAAGLTQSEAAALIYVHLKTWQKWETGEELPSHRAMHQAVWELFLQKTKKKK